MVYFLETDISNTKKIRYSLKKIYGLGHSSLDSICYKLGITKNTRICDLSEFKVKQLNNFINSAQFLITADLKKKEIKYAKHLVSLKCQKGLRRLKGLPVRGQRTHTNAKNAKKRYLFIKYEINTYID